MAKNDPEVAALRDQLTDALAEVQGLQAIAADAEARLVHQREQLASVQAELVEAKARLAESASAQEEGQALMAEKDEEMATVREQLAAVQAEGGAAQAELVETRGQLQESAVKYREARLNAAPEVPPDLIPGETIEEIDQQFEAALRIVGDLRERLESQQQSARVPIGSPPRREPDLSGLSAAEKIKLGLERR